MKIPQLLYRRLSPYLKKQGFIKRGSTYYKIENDIAFCITLDFPSYVKTWCHILPLYMPTEFLHMTHGNLIDGFYHSIRDTLSKYDDVSDTQINIWIDEITAIFEYDVFPFFDSILTPRALLEYCELSPNMRNKYLPYIGGHHMLRLQAYTALYLGELKTAEKAVENFKKSVLQDALLTPNMTNRYLSEADEMTKMLSFTSAERDVLFGKICKKTFEACFMPRKRS